MLAPVSAALPSRPLDFAVIGAAKSGTTSLWESARHHPEILAPQDKERSFFNQQDVFDKGLEAFVKRTYPDATPEQKIGVFSPILMSGGTEKLELWVDNMARTCPDILIVAILRDPIDRALSHFRMAKRSGTVEHGTAFEDYVMSHKATKARGPWNLPGIVDSNYGRILTTYAERFPREQFLVLYTEQLDRRPLDLYRELFTFLGVDAEYVPTLPRLNVGGDRARVSAAALAEITKELNTSVFPHIADKNIRAGFNWWLRNLWNIEPDEPGTVVPEELSVKFRAEMAEHFIEDALLLRKAVGTNPPWITSLKQAAAAAPAPASA